MSDTYENAYVGVDPATVWQSPPINTPAEIQKYKDQGMLPVDSLGNVVEETEPIEGDNKDAETETEGEGDDPKVGMGASDPANPVETDETITQPLL